MPATDRSLSDWLAYQERLHPRDIELGLERVAAVAQRLGLPSTQALTLSVAGTNGKGSSATLAALIYQTAGYRVGLYTSPHLLRYNERIVIDGVEAADDDLCLAFSAIEVARGATPLTYFEFGTLAALWLFERAGVQIQILEVGLGGRLDAVNLVDADCALVTQIGLDHLDWLGPDRESIGHEKAGIYRAGCPAICADPQPPASVQRHALATGADWRALGTDFHFSVDTDKAENWSWFGTGQYKTQLSNLPLPGLQGAAQLRNAAGVIAAIQSLQNRLPVPEAAIRAALPQLRLRGRFQRIGRWCFDVAHNAEAAVVLADSLRSAFGDRRPWLIFGMLSDKPVEAVVAVLAPEVSGVIFVGVEGPRGLSAAALQARAATVGVSGLTADRMEIALDSVMAQTDSTHPVVICGSFLTVAAALQQLKLESA